ncbi:tryptophan synthase subunit beta like protein [Sansalvadorimonas verongulae]|uniref:tryptophan synthase subunit beta like protein n=1 Tax=Sansalvadorimonas verongulae TaxID=2172824 RepID=UPI0012BD10AC|nr:tryptophan synthase subunit beta like protein [Sansalvadorimonas verongulae]MTI15312.1 tryptophan synthase subunit beta like protein [Sansalvadorimonas verongulae]
MLYGLRDDDGILIAIGEQAVSEQWQELDQNSREVLRFLNKQRSSDLEDSDKDFIRVLDDLIELMIEKQLFQFTELPQPAQDKLLKRRWYRQQLRGDDDTTHLIDPQEGLL